MSAFSQQLKELRIKRKLTQKECSIFLSEHKEELINVDYVSISRWEQGVVKPSVKKQVMILRVLGGDVKKVLHESVSPGTKRNSIELWAEKKYDTISQMLISGRGPDQIRFCSVKRASDVNEAYEVIDSLKTALRTLRLNEYNSFNQYEEYIKEHFHCVTHCKDNTDLVGYSIDFLFRASQLPNLVKETTQLSLPATAPPTERDLILYSYVRFYAHSCAFKQLTYDLITRVIENPNIEKLVVRVMDQELYKWLNSIGFEVYTVQNNSPVNKISIGKRNYAMVVMQINAESFLSNINIRQFMIEHELSSPEL